MANFQITQTKVVGNITINTWESVKSNAEIQEDWRRKAKRQKSDVITPNKACSRQGEGSRQTELLNPEADTAKGNLSAEAPCG